jgi:hypothetical protein
MSIAALIGRLSESRLKRQLDDSARSALQILSGENVDYNHYWLAPSEPGTEVPPQGRQVGLPGNLYYDTLKDQSRPLYETGSVIVESESYRHISFQLPLERCGGPFVSILQSNSTMLPMPDSILVFTPRVKRGEAWRNFDAAMRDGSLYQTLQGNDPLNPVDFPADTRAAAGYQGPAIFISFAWPDIQVVREIANILNERRRRYYLLVDSYQGVGGTPAANSVRAAEDAEAVLVVASSNYANRYRDLPDGNVAREFFVLSRRYATESLPIVVLSADEHSAIEGRLPWSAIGFDGVPFIGQPLRGATAAAYAKAVDEVISVIDGRLAG